jgi:hypothetical protein
MKIKYRALRACRLYIEAVKTEPGLKSRFCAKVWGFSDIGVLTFDEARGFIDQIIDNASEAERRNERNACH